LLRFTGIHKRIGIMRDQPELMMKTPSAYLHVINPASGGGVPEQRAIGGFFGHEARSIEHDQAAGCERARQSVTSK
jgi:hypothetical protein